MNAPSDNGNHPPTEIDFYKALAAEKLDEIRRLVGQLEGAVERFHELRTLCGGGLEDENSEMQFMLEAVAGLNDEGSLNSDSSEKVACLEASHQESIAVERELRAGIPNELARSQDIGRRQTRAVGHCQDALASFRSGDGGAPARLLELLVILDPQFKHIPLQKVSDVLSRVGLKKDGTPKKSPSPVTLLVSLIGDHEGPGPRPLNDADKDTIDKAVSKYAER